MNVSDPGIELRARVRARVRGGSRTRDSPQGESETDHHVKGCAPELYSMLNNQPYSMLNN